MKRIQLALSLLVSSLWTLSVNATLVGTTPGDFTVSPSGAATYTVPIELPPTVGGVKPSLALSYNSQAGNGIAGIGWGLSGLSSITRCPTTLAQDGFIDGVDFDSNDKFCLDGQRLNAVKGTYGADGTEYRTELDSFSKIIGYGSVDNGPATFTVWTKSGEVMEYALVTASSSSNKTASWQLGKLSDSLGNYFKVNYHAVNMAIGGQPRTIEFYSNDESLNEYSVFFKYEARPDKIEAYQAGKKTEQFYRLNAVRILKDNTSVQREYKLSYLASYKSKIDTITKCENEDECLSGLKIVWKGTDQIGFNAATGRQVHAGGFGTHDAYTESVGDINGDGTSDLIWMYSGASGLHAYSSLGNGDGTYNSATGGQLHSGGFGTYDAYTKLTADINADGLTDLIWMYSGSSGLHLYTSLSNGDGTFKPATGRQAHSGGFGSYTAYSKSLGDVNGDGKTDLIWMYSGSSGLHAYIAQGNGDGTFNTATGGQLHSGGFGTYDAYTKLTADINADGLTDLIWMYSGSSGLHLYTSLSNGDGTFKPATGRQAHSGGFGSYTAYSKSLGDVNGDGVTDLIWMYSGSSGLHAYTSIGNGDGTFSAATGGKLFTGGFGTYNAYSKLAADINADGLTDLIWAYSGSSGLHQYVAIANGDGSFQTAFGGQIHTGGFGEYHQYSKRVGDINGDGVADLIWMYSGSSGLHAYYSQSKFNRDSRFIESIKDSRTNEARVTWSYESLSMGDAYSKGDVSLISYPKLVVQNSTYVVSSVQTPNGLGNMNVVDYSYLQSAINLYGRGGLGFKKITATNVNTNTVSSTEYSQTYPYTGMPISSTTTVNGRTVSRTLSTPAQKTLNHSNGASTLFVYAGDSTSYSYDYDNPSTDLDSDYLSKVVTSNEVFDDFGNPEDVIVNTYGNGNQWLQRATTDSIYTNDVSQWRLGRLTDISVKHESASATEKTKTSKFNYHPSTGLLRQEIIEPYQPNHTLTTTYEYDSFGNRNQVTVSGFNHTFNAVDGSVASSTPFTRTTSTVYEAAADGSYPAGLFPTKITNAKGHEENRIYDPLYGSVKSTTGPNLIPTIFEYDELGRQTKVIPSVGKPSITTYSWCTSGGCPDSNGYKITKSVEGVSGSATVYFDRYGREVRKTSTDRNGGLITVDTEYDSLGRVSKVYEPYNSSKPKGLFTESKYDAAGRVSKVIRPDLKYVTTSFNGLTTTTTDVKFRNTVTTKNALGQTEVITDPALGTVRYEYDAVGNLLKTKTKGADTGEVTVELFYDLRGNKIKMIDPDMGTWLYGHSTAGELLWQKDAKGQETSMVYDSLGRMSSRTDGSGTSTWEFDTANKGKGKLHKVKQNGVLFKELSYDSAGRPNATTTNIDTINYTTSTTYDPVFGRLNTLEYPGSFTLRYNYNSHGSLESIVNDDKPSTYYWRYEGQCDNKPGATCVERYGDRSTEVNGFAGIQVSKGFDDIHPWLVQQTAVVDNIFTGQVLQNSSYEYDDNLSLVGNLSRRTDHLKNLSETFTYDNLDRVETATLNGALIGSYSYDGLGNMSTKNDVGSYYYGESNNAGQCGANTFAGPHAVTKTSLNSVDTFYCYDANGNLVNGKGRTVTWNSFNKPIRMTQNGKWAEFSYGPDRSRYKKHSPDFTAIHYVGMGGTGNVLYEKELQSNGQYVARNHIYVGGKRIAVKIDYSNAPTTDPEVVHYLLTDHLGSVTTIVNQDGNVVRRKSFDVWGKERNPDTWSGTAALDTDNHRGYTGHESIQEVGLIHMNGRVYDPVLARFVSADPYIQAANSSQSYNRYSYVWNNPLKNVDPSGYFLSIIVNAAFTSKGREEISRATDKVRKELSRVESRVRHELGRFESKYRSKIKDLSRKFLFDQFGIKQHYNAYKLGGWKGVAAGMVAEAINGVFITFQIPITVSLSYTYDSGWGGSIGFGVNGVAVSARFQEGKGYVGGNISYQHVGLDFENGKGIVGGSYSNSGLKISGREGGDWSASYTEGKITYGADTQGNISASYKVNYQSDGKYLKYVSMDSVTIGTGASGGFINTVAGVNFRKSNFSINNNTQGGGLSASGSHQAGYDFNIGYNAKNGLSVDEGKVAIRSYSYQYDYLYDFKFLDTLGVTSRLTGRDKGASI